MSEQPAVYNVTSARVPLSRDQAARNRRYLISMSIRVICFVASIPASGWLRWACFIGAVVLPWVAVVIANAGRENKPVASQSFDAAPWSLER